MGIRGGELFVAEMSEDLTCGICHNVLDTSMQCHDGHTFCNKCITSWLQREKTCPACRTELLPTTLGRNLIVDNMIGSLVVCCETRLKSCGEDFERKDWGGLIHAILMIYCALQVSPMGLPHPATGAGIYPQPYPALLPYGAPGHTPYHHLPPEYLPVQPGWGLAGGQGVPPSPSLQEAPLADPLGTPPRSTLTILGSGGERQNLSGSATADLAAGSYSAGQPLPSYGGTSPAYSPFDQPPADQPRARRLLGKKKVSFEADAGGTGLGEPVPPTATGESLAAPPAAGLSGRPEHGVDSGEPRAGVGARGDGVVGKHSRCEGPYPTASVPVEPHKELTLDPLPPETSELS
eukprot:gene34421-biopygen29304